MTERNKIAIAGAVLWLGLAGSITLNLLFIGGVL